LRQGSDELCNVKYLFLIVVLFISLLLPVVVIARLLNLRYLPRHPIDAFLNVVQAVLKLQFPGLLDMEEKLIDEFVDHAEGGVFEGDVFEVFEDEHHAILEGVDGVDVLLVFRLDLEEGAHEAHALQVARKLRVPVVPPESLQNVFYLLALLALALGQLAEAEPCLVDAYLIFAEVFQLRLSGDDWLCQELFAEVL
jgi:hypothetical protein